MPLPHPLLTGNLDLNPGTNKGQASERKRTTRVASPFSTVSFFCGPAALPHIAHRLANLNSDKGRARALSSVSKFTTTMSSPTAGQGSSIFQHLRAIKKILQGVVPNAKCIWSVGIRRVGGLILMFAARSLGTAKVK